MGKKLKKVLTIVVTFAMVFSSLIILNPVNAEGEEQTYAEPGHLREQLLCFPQPLL